MDAPEAARVQAQHPAADSDDPPITNPQNAEAALRQLLRDSGSGPDPPTFGVASNPTGQGQELPEEDHMMRLLQQLLGGSLPNAQPGHESSQSGGIPPEIAAALHGGPQSGSLCRPGGSTSVLAWKVLHTVFTLALGIYVLSQGTSVDSHLSRLETGFISPTDKLNIFWAFVTVELGLQAARFILEGEKKSSGAVGMLAGFLPSPWKERLFLAARYTGIWTTMVEDAMTIVWLFGVAAWWNGSPT